MTRLAGTPAPMFKAINRAIGWAIWPAAAVAVLVAAWIAADTFTVMAVEHAGLPFWDGWGSVWEYHLLRTDQFGLKELFAQQNEHRIAAGRLLFQTDFVAFGGRGVFLSVCIGASLTGLAALLIWTARPADKREWGFYAISAAAAAGCLLSLLATENLLWIFQVPFVLLYFSAAAGLYCTLRACEAAKAQGRWGAWLAAAALAYVTAVYCMANGLAAIGLGIVLAVLLRAPWRLTAALCLLFAGLIAAYFHGYESRTSAGSLPYVLDHPDILANYLFAFIGNLLRNTPTRDVDTIRLGMFGFVLCGGVAWRMLVRRDLDAPRLVLVGMMLFSLAAALASGAGRLADNGLIQAYAPRYVTPTAVFWACQVLYWSSAARAWPAWLRILPVIGAGLLLRLLVNAQELSRADAASLLARISREADAVLVGVHDPAAELDSTPLTQNLARDLDFLRQDNKSIFAEPRAHWMGQPLAAAGEVDGECLGAVDRAWPLAGDPRALRITGWSWDAKHDRQIERLIAVGPDGRIVGLASGGEIRLDVVQAMPTVDRAANGWAGYARGVPGDVLTVYGVTGAKQVCLVGKTTAAP